MDQFTGKILHVVLDLGKLCSRKWADLCCFCSAFFSEKNEYSAICRICFYLPFNIEQSFYGVSNADFRKSYPFTLRSKKASFYFVVFWKHNKIGNRKGYNK